MSCARRVSAAGLLLACLGLSGASGCLYDSNNRCDQGQKFDAAGGLCVCTGNNVAGDHGCVACGDNQTAQDGVCVCVSGYQLNGTSCELVPLALGAACATDPDCSDQTYGTCHVPDGKAGYCTNTGCTKDADCQGGYGCNVVASPSFCEQPPSGQGMHCASDDDCKGTDATYCEVFRTQQCYVRDCSLSKNDCFAGYECCDLALLSSGVVQEHLCVKSGTCKL